MDGATAEQAYSAVVEIDDEILKLENTSISAADALMEVIEAFED